MQGFIKNKRGQAFESYRLLIAFAIGVAVLTIIYAMVTAINQRAILISVERLREGSLSATKNIGNSETPFYLKDLMLSGRISSQQISNYSGMPYECIYLDAGIGLTEVIDGEEYKIDKSSIKMDVYFYCDFTDAPDVSDTATEVIIKNIKNNTNGTCPTFCIVYLNKYPSYLSN